MTYVAPPTFSAGATLAAADLNILSADIVALKALCDAMAFSGISLSRATAQSIPNAAFTDVSWSTAPVMEGGTWWTSGATATVPVGTVPPGFTSVVLEIQIQARFAVNGTGARAVEVLLNGGVVERAFYTSGVAGEYTVVATTVWAIAVDGDTIKGDVYQTSGAALNADSMSMHIKRIGYI